MLELKSLWIPRCSGGHKRKPPSLASRLQSTCVGSSPRISADPSAGRTSQLSSILAHLKNQPTSRATRIKCWGKLSGKNTSEMWGEGRSAAAELKRPDVDYIRRYFDLVCRCKYTRTAQRSCSNNSFRPARNADHGSRDRGVLATPK